MVRFLNRFGFWISLVICVAIYLALAYKNPFKDNNLISNLEPPPDVFYYSVPGWNLVHGNGFKMMAFGKEISQLSTPVYGIYLSPFFALFKDVRSYYFANMLLGFLSIYLFLRLAKEIFGKEKWFLNFSLGLILVTNFYFYNLPTLLMAENILIPLTLIATMLMFKKLDLVSFVLNLLVMVILAFSKISRLPVIFIQGIVLLVKIIQSKFWLNLSKKYIYMLSIVSLLLMSIVFVKIVLPAIKAFSNASAAGNFSPIYISKTFPIYLKEFFGVGGSYLWYNNQHIEMFVAIISLCGLVVGLFLKNFRFKVIKLISVILVVTLFHSMMSYPEGRYISTVIPLFILFSGIIFYQLKYSFLLLVFLGIYFLSRGKVNGFYERKVTVLKRQILNNQREENEMPWNHLAINRFNNYFSDKNNVYLGTLLNPFYIMFFGNGNYTFLPLSANQEFSGPGKGFIDKYLENDKTIIGLYERILKEGNELYVTNYYLTYYKGGLDEQYYNLEKVFKFTQVDEGCLGECKLYKLELKK